MNLHDVSTQDPALLRTGRDLGMPTVGRRGALENGSEGEPSNPAARGPSSAYGRLLPPGTYATPDDGDVVTLGRTE